MQLTTNQRCHEEIHGNSCKKNGNDCHFNFHHDQPSCIQFPKSLEIYHHSSPIPCPWGYPVRMPLAVWCWSSTLPFATEYSSQSHFRIHQNPMTCNSGRTWQNKTLPVHPTVKSRIPKWCTDHRKQCMGSGTFSLKTPRLGIQSLLCGTSWKNQRPQQQNMACPSHATPCGVVKVLRHTLTKFIQIWVMTSQNFSSAALSPCPWTKQCQPQYITVMFIPSWCHCGQLGARRAATVGTCCKRVSWRVEGCTLQKGSNQLDVSDMNHATTHCFLGATLEHLKKKKVQKPCNGWHHAGSYVLLVNHPNSGA